MAGVHLLSALFALLIVHQPAELVAAVAVVAVLALLAGIAVVPARAPAWVRSLAIRSRRADFSRSRDPDAAGRARPRAPGFGLGVS